MKNLNISLNFDLAQFLKFFGQLSPGNKNIIFNALKAIVQPNKSIPFGEFPLKGSVVKYDSPFSAVAEKDWESIK